MRQTKNQYVFEAVMMVPFRAGNDETAATYKVIDSVGIYFVNPARTSSFDGGCGIAAPGSAARRASVLILILYSPYGDRPYLIHR